MIFESETGLKLTLKKASPEWFNHDCPSILAPDGTRIVKNTINGFSFDEWGTFISKKDLAKFVLNSYKAFCRKYNHEIDPEWYINDDLFN